MRIGNVEVHGSSSHQVTDCVHRHGEKTETGAMRMSGGTAPVSPQSQAASGKEELSALWNPFERLKDLLRKGRGLALRLWGNDLPGASEGKIFGTTAVQGQVLSGVPGQETTRTQPHDDVERGARQMPP